MANTGARTLRLLSLLQTHRYWQGIDPGVLTVVWGGPAGEGIDPGMLTAVTLACRDSEQLRFSSTAADGRRIDRHTEPHRLVCLGRRWYLVAYDLTWHDWRSFRVDRLTAPQGNSSRFRPRDLPAADAAEFVRAGLDNLSRSYRVEVLKCSCRAGE